MTLFTACRTFTKTSLLLTSTLLLTQCDGGSSTRLKGLRDEIEQLNRQNYEIQQNVSRLQSQIDASRAEKKKLEEEKSKIEADRDATSKQLEQLKKDFETYKANYKLSMQKRAPGLPIEDFVSADGKSFQHVVLREITDSQVNFTHEGGIMKLHFKQLPESLQATLGFLIQPVEAPHKVVSMSNREVNNLRLAEKESSLYEVQSKITALGDQRFEATRRMSKIKDDIALAVKTSTPHDRLILEREQLDLYIRQISNQILQLEVEVYGIRSKKVDLLPER
jgi:predicted  nucleic acid-binding Zn-ribbon protein